MRLTLTALLTATLTGCVSAVQPTVGSSPGPSVPPRTPVAGAQGVIHGDAAAFLENAARENGATKTPSGLIYVELRPGTGDQPGATDRVEVHYKGFLMDGTVFGESVVRGQPEIFPLDALIPCWTEGIQMMKVGGKSKLICPPHLAYGNRGSPPSIKPGDVLIFEVELLQIVR